MKKLKYIISIFTVIFLLTVFTGCNGGKDKLQVPGENQQGQDNNSEENQGNNDENQSGETKNPTLDDIVKSIKQAYGDDYLPNRELTEDEAVELFGLNRDDIEQIKAEMPMISAHVDTLVLIKCKKNRGPQVEKNMEDYRSRLIEDSLQYPQNQAKVNASEVYRNNDYVFFVMLGKINDNMDMNDNDSLTFAREQIKIGMDKIKDFFI